jgi:hypothetical protein
MKLIVATCQFPVDADIRRNTEYVLRQMRHRQGSFVRPDGVITGSLRRNTAGILLSTWTFASALFVVHEPFDAYIVST